MTLEDRGYSRDLVLLPSLSEPEIESAPSRADPARGPVVMYMRWRRLLFLHWSVPPDLLQRSLPPGLRIDTHAGRAWLGIVPFFMTGVRPRAMPSLPGLSSFLELNVRTYVRDLSGRPGVWFYSLDANHWLAVQAARCLFSLNYHWARMAATPTPDGGVSGYSCSRRSATGKPARFSYTPRGPIFRAEPGSLEEFLVERYRLYAWFPGAKMLLTDRIAHSAYPLQQAEVTEWSTAPVGWNGLPELATQPENILFSPGVDVRVLLPERAPINMS